MAVRLSSAGEDLGLPARRKTFVPETINTKKSRIPGPGPSTVKPGVRQSLVGNKRGSISKSLGKSSIGHANNRVSLQSANKRSSRSSVAGGQTGVKKDTRPLSDKGYQQSCIKKLRTFLIEEHYPREVKPKCLHTPSTTEFLYILNFILERLDPSLVFSGLRMEEEIPYLIKLLKYPFNVSKNHLLNIGSPHSWPILLGFLMWLINLCLMEDQSDNILFPATGEFDEENNNEKNCVELNNELYRVYLTIGPEDEYKELLSVKKTSQEKIIEVLEEDLAQQRKIEQELLEECSLLEQSSIESLEKKCSEWETDFEQQLDYLNNELGPSIEAYSNDTAAIEKQIATQESQIEISKEKIADLVEHIKTQPMSAKEAKALQQKIKEKQDTRLTLKRRVEEAREGVFELQRCHGNKVSQVDRECKEVNDSLRKLSTILPDSEYIPLLDYNTSKRADPNVLDQLVKQVKTIKSGIHQLDERTAQELANLESKNINAESEISALQNEIALKQIELENGEHKIQREKKLLDQLKKKREDNMKLVLSSKIHLENRIMELQVKLQDNHIEQELEAVTAKHDLEYERAVVSICEKTQTLQKMCQAMSAYLEKQKRKQKNAHQEYKKLLEMFKQLKDTQIQTKYCPQELLEQAAATQ